MKRKQKFEVAINKVCNLRLTREYVEIEAKDKQWKVQFGNKTREYAQITYLVANKDIESLNNLAALLYQSRAIVTDSLFLKFFVEATKKYFKAIEKQAKENAKKVSEKEDAVAFAEEKVLHEQTPESVEELENAKKDVE